jgi:hypothetical protein
MALQYIYHCWYLYLVVSGYRRRRDLADYQVHLAQLHPFLPWFESPGHQSRQLPLQSTIPAVLVILRSE